LRGRDGELAVIGERLADARDGRGTVLFVQGRAGYGKTRLLAEAAAMAGQTHVEDPRSQRQARGGGERSLDDVQDVAPGGTGDPKRAEAQLIELTGCLTRRPFVLAAELPAPYPHAPVVHRALQRGRAPTWPRRG
jgi:hypothetical protein